jgi:hypothetical protein
MNNHNLVALSMLCYNHTKQRSAVLCKGIAVDANAVTLNHSRQIQPGG